ncbi:MAG: Na/Pi cotransporter family protein [Lachnospiraceae bacterium]|nr:Na/Pi cotransporter family protein [Lachnospiraceae bacterium]
MDIFNVISMLGGVGLFLFGMSLMGENLEKVAGAGLEHLLERLTNNRIKGFALGIGVTAIIQSSAATTVMVLGFVNAGIMKLVQAIPVVFGANIGSTVTAQILRFSGGSSDSLWLQLCKPSTIAPLLVCAAAFILLISKKNQLRNVAGILMGFGILFIGMNTMETALSPLSQSSEFQNLFLAFSNPLLGFLVGMVVTMILQSSSASVGILQALAFSTGSLTFSACLPIIVGQNVGKCITVILGSLGTGKKAKRLAVSHVCFNVFGAVIIMGVMYTLQAIFHFPFWDHVMTKGNIADTHLLFNVITSLILLPFVKQIADFTGLIIRGDKDSKIDQEIALLDDIFLSKPPIALEQCSKVINSMADTVMENFTLATELLSDGWDDAKYEIMQENEVFLDKSETALSEYLVKVTAQGLSHEQSRFANELLNSVSDFERMGDYCIKIAKVVIFNQEQNISFSRIGLTELDYMIRAVKQTLEEGLKAFRTEDLAVATKIEPLCQTVDALKDMLKEHHINRLQTGNCSTAAGISLMEVITSLDRIASHCFTVTLHMMQKKSTLENFDLHEQKHNIRHSEAEADIALIQYYENLYLSPVKQLGTKTELDIPAAEKKEPEEPKSSGKKKSELVKENMKENMKKKKEKAEEAKKKMVKHKK